MGVCMKQMNNEIIYPRSEEEVLLILATAKKEGHLLEIVFDEFVKKPFSMPVLWGCRAYFYGLKKKSCQHIRFCLLILHCYLLWMGT